MAGNDSGARRQAETALREARNAGVTGETLAGLQAAADAAWAKERSSTGSNPHGYRPGR